MALGKSVQRCPETHRSAKLHGRAAVVVASGALASTVAALVRRGGR